MTLNVWTISGYTAKDTDLRYSANAMAIGKTGCYLRLYRPVGEAKEWVTLKAFGKLAERLGEQFPKGTAFMASGRLDIEKWTDKEGKERTETVLILSDIHKMPGQGNKQAEVPYVEPQMAF